MSKRFTDSTKWTSKPWFRKLSPVEKCLWFYVCDACDVAGVIQLDLELASFVIGEEITEKHVDSLEKQLDKLSEGVYWIKDFVGFQYGVLSEECRPHKKVIEKLKGYSKGIQTLFDTLQDKDKEKEEDKEEDKTKTRTPVKRFIPPTIEEVAEYCQTRNNTIDPEAFIAHYETNGWKQSNGNKVKDWKAAVITWEKYAAKRQPSPSPSGNAFLDL